MPRAKVVDRAPVEILLDDGGADVRRARNGRRVSEALADDCASPPPRGALPPSRSPGRSRSARATAAISVPPQVRKSFAVNSSPMCLADVLVQLAVAQVAVAAVRKLVAEEPATALERPEGLHRLGELGVHDRSANPDLVLSAVLERDPASPDAHVALVQRRDSEAFDAASCTGRLRRGTSRD